MRKLGLVLGFVFFATFLFSQDIVRNRKAPLNPEAGRVLNIEEVLRIPAEGEGWYHNGARTLDVDGEGNIYINDSWHTGMEIHFLKFSPEGRFIGNLYRQGEGPGEINNFYEFALGDERIYVVDVTKRKLIVVTMDGELVEEISFEKINMSGILGLVNGGLVVVRDEYPVERVKSGMYGILHHFGLLPLKGGEVKPMLTLTHEMFFIASGLGGGMRSWAPTIFKLKDGRLISCTTCEYLIEVDDLKAEGSPLRFNRDYPRVRHELLDWEPDFNKKYNAPRKKYENDVRNLFIDGGFVWVETSTVDENKGKLFDLFDFEGRFLDSFYIPVAGDVVNIIEGSIYTTESDAEELPVVVKYRITEPVGGRL